MLYILSSVLLICVLIAYEKRKSDRAMKTATEEFWERERQANTARKKDISGLPYITVPYDTLPLTELPDSEEYAAAVSKLKGFSDKKILDLSGMSNTDLKLTYGPANLPALMECDQNYIVLIRTLAKMAVLLMDAGLDAAAESVLLFSLECKSSIRSTYEMLALIYQKRGDVLRLDDLIFRVSTLSLTSKEALLSSLNELREQLDSEYNLDELFSKP